MSRRWSPSAWLWSLFPSEPHTPGSRDQKPTLRSHFSSLEGLEDRITPAVALSIADPVPITNGNGGTSDLLFVVTRSGDLGPGLTVQFQTVDGTAQAGVDYQATSGTLSFVGGQATATIAVPIIGDMVVEPTESFTVTLSDPQLVGPPPAFASQNTVGVGTGPRFAALGDVNGDGRPDLAVANSDSNSVSVLLNTTAPGATVGSFAPQATVGVGSSPVSVVLGDINGDGRPDLAVANANSDSVSVLLNTTAPGAVAPTFAPQNTVGVGDLPRFVALGDVNGDGRPDLAVANSNSNSVSLLLNTTAAGATAPLFSPQNTVGVGPGPISLALGDVNGDGRPDLAVANANNISVLLNTTAAGVSIPTFAPQNTVGVGTGPISLALGDINGDGRPDLAVANGNSNLDNVAVLLNRTAPGATAPSFASQATFAVGVDPSAVVLGDFDGDFRPDLIVPNRGPESVSVLVNRTAPLATAPSFASQATFAVGVDPYAVAVGDVNGDGRPDLAVANFNANNVSVLLNTTALAPPTPGFAPQATFASPSRPHDVVVADVNGDGRPDLVNTNGYSNLLEVRLSTTTPGAITPAFAAAVTFATPAFPIAVAPGDFNGDGRPDLAVANRDNNSASVLLNQTAPGATVGSFAPQATVGVGTRPGFVTIGDINGDGRPDLAVSNYDSNNVSVLLNQTAPGATFATFAAAVAFPVGVNPVGASLGDVNGDGRPDLITANFVSDTVSVLLNRTAPGATAASFATQATFATLDGAFGVTVGDLNGDGRPDLAVANINSTAASLLLNMTAPGATAPSFATQNTVGVGANPSTVTVGDLNGDGRPDLAVSNRGSNTVSLLLNTTLPGATFPTFAPQATVGTGTDPRNVIVADFNGDFQLDLAVGNTGTDNNLGVLTALPIALADASGSGTIIDDDVPMISIGDVTVTEGNTGTVTATFTISLSDTSAQTVTVSAATADGTGIAPGDYTAVAATLVSFAPGQTSQTFTVTVNGDLLDEIDETFFVNLSSASNAMILDGEGVGIITDDDDAPTVSVGDVTVTEGDAGTTTATFTISLSAASGQDVEASVSLADGTATFLSDYGFFSDIFVVPIPAGTTSQSFDITILGDTVFEADETFFVNLDSATNATVADNQGAGTITNDDAAPVVTLTLSGSPFAENGGTATVTVSLANASSDPVTVGLTFGGTATGTDYTASATSVTIPAGELSATVTLTGVNDTSDEAPETVVVGIGTVDNGVADDPSSVTATVTDDDSPSGGVDAFATAEDTPLTVAAPGVLGNDLSNGTPTATVATDPANGTLALGTDGGFTYTPDADFNGTDSFTYRANIGTEQSVPITVTITVRPVNDAPSFTTGPDQRVVRQPGPQTVPGWATGITAGPADEAGQGLSFLITTDNPGLFAVAPAIDPTTGTLTYTPTGTGFGTATVTVQFRDDGGTANGGSDTSAVQTFTIAVSKHKSGKDGAIDQNEFPLYAVGAGAGGPGTVILFGADGTVQSTSAPFADGNGARAAVADVTGDGVADIVATTGPGRSVLVVVIDGATGDVVKTLQPFEPTFLGGAFVAAADVDGDGFADIAVTADESGGARVVIYSGRTDELLANFFGIEDSAFRGGARAALGDVNADGLADLAVAAGTGGGPRMAVWDGASLRTGGRPIRLVPDFFVFEDTLRDGTYVTVGDLNGDGFGDVIVSGGPQGGPRVMGLDGRSLVEGGQFVPLINFFADDPNLRVGGARPTAKDFDGDRQAELVVSVPTGTTSVITTYTGQSLAAGDTTPESDFELLPGLTSGVFVG